MSDLQDPIEAPVPGVAAFERDDEAARLSRAAFLLCLGLQVRELLQPLLDEMLPGAVSHLDAADEIELADWRLLEVPTLRSSSPPPAGRIWVQSEYGIKEGDPSVTKQLRDLAYQLARGSETKDALALFECGLQNSDPLTRVASAIAYANWTLDPSLLAILATEVQSNDWVVATLARNALARLTPHHPALRELAPDVEPTPGRRSSTSLLVHGTWARSASWWQPGGGFHGYLLARHVQDLYARPDRYEWSGAWSDQARALAALQLGRWLAARSISPVAKLIAHSHGANVAMLGTHGTVVADQLVLLSCPVHKSKYLPNFAQVNDVVSFQVHMDVVVLADGGRLRFRHPQIRDETIPMWFKHDALHDERVWDRYDVASRL